MKEKKSFLFFIFLLAVVVFVSVANFSNQKIKGVKTNQRASGDAQVDLWLPGLEDKIQSSTPPPVLSALSVLAFDYANDKFIYTNNPNLPLPVASTAKIMTAIVALDNKKLSDVFTVSEEAASQEPDVMGLYPGEKLNLEQLLYGLLLVSGNDAAYTIAEGVSGTEEKFVKKMNEKAKSLGLKNTFFVNSSGLDADDKEQFSSAYDLLLMSHYALENFPVFAKIVKTNRYQISSRVDEKENHKEYNLINSSPLVNYPGYLGIKPGFTPFARRCLVTLVERNGKKVLTVVLGSEDRKGETESLLDYSFQVLEESSRNNPIIN